MAKSKTYSIADMNIIVTEDDSKHFFNCSICGQKVDMRDLGQVFEHEHEDLPKPTFKSSKRVGDSVEWKGGDEPLHLS